MSDKPPAPASALAPSEYKTGKILGSGSYATVKEAVKISTNERFAVKVISKKLMAGKEYLILNEIDILKKVSMGHPNIVTLHDYFESPNNLYLVMDLCSGGELFDRIYERGSFYEEDAAYIAKILVDAVNYLHSKNIVHRDIKPENLLMRSKDSFEIVIGDFGLSRIIDIDKYSPLKTTCGTPGYMAPEIISRSGHGKPVDMWCIGVLVYFVLSGYMPFDPLNTNSSQEVKNILAGKFDFNDEDFISSLLIVDPSKRLTAEQALAHAWISDPSSTLSTSPMSPITPILETAVFNTPTTASVPKPPGCTIDLLPAVRDRFNARKAFQKAIGGVKAVNLFLDDSDKDKNSKLQSEANSSTGLDNAHLDSMEQD